jgi:phage tail-like protein
VSLTPFTRELGSVQGRIAPGLVPPDQGDHVLVLGSDARGRKWSFASGDGVTIAQNSANPGVAFLRPRVHLRPATTPPPAGVAWTLEAKLDGATVLSIPVDRPRDLADVALCVVPFDPAAFDLEFRLSVAGVGGPWELELPAAYVDAIFADSSANRPVLTNRSPEPAEKAVPRSTVIKVDIADPGFATSAAAGALVYVNGILAWNGTTFTAGWNGAGSSAAVIDGGHTVRIVIDPMNDFASLETVTVRVVYVAPGDGAQLDTTYSFQIEDATPPQLVFAQAQNRRTVRVGFSEPVVEAEALDPENWEIEIVEGPQLEGWGDYRAGAAVWVRVAGVDTAGGFFDITTDVPMTMRATYRVAASGIHDLFGNLVDPAGSARVFQSVDTRLQERRFELVDHVPRLNIREDETQDLRRFLWAWQEPLEHMLSLADEWPDLLDPDTAPEPFLDAMLADLGNPFTFPLTVVQKRKLVILLPTIFQEKGSAEGIINAIRLFTGIEVTITYPNATGLKLGYAKIGTTFVLGGGAAAAYTYRVVSPVILDDEQRLQIRSIAEYMQATNERLIEIKEPGVPPPNPNHLVLGYSKLGVNWKLH